MLVKETTKRVPARHRDKVVRPVVCLIKKKSHNPLMGVNGVAEKEARHHKRIEESALLPGFRVVTNKPLPLIP